MPRGLFWVWVVVAMGVSLPAHAAVWRGSTELTFQRLQSEGARSDFWRYFIDVSAEDRFLVRNRILLGLRLEGRHFGADQPSETRPRWHLEMTGAGYALTGLYAPFTVDLAGAVKQRERQYNLSLAVFPAKWPITTWTWNRFSRSLDHVPNDRRDTYTFTIDYERGFWRGQGRLLRQDRTFTVVVGEENLTSALLNNIFTLYRRYWSGSARYQMEHTDRKVLVGRTDKTTVHNLAGQFRVQPERRVTASAEFDGRFVEGARAMTNQSTRDLVAIGRLNVRPVQPLEFAAVRYYSRNDVPTTDAVERNYTQLQAAVAGRFLGALLGTLSGYRTWNHVFVNTGRVNDAVYVRVAGDIWAHTTASFEASYSDLHFGELPISTVRSATLRSHLLRDSRLQVQYGAQGSTDRFQLFAIQRQNLNISWQQTIGNRSHVTLGLNRIQERVISTAWLNQWYVTASFAVRNWALLSGTYNRVEDVQVLPGAPEPTAKPTRSDVQLTMYPERRWVWSFNWYETTSAAGRRATFWGGTLRYRL